MYDSQSKKDGKPYNTTFFQEIGGVKYQDWKMSQSESAVLIQKVQWVFASWVAQLELVASQLWAEERGNDAKNDIEKRGLESMILSFRMASLAVPIELEKASNVPVLKDAERDSLKTSIDQYQSQIYGPKISENPEEVTMTLELICAEYVEGKKYLSPEQQGEYIACYRYLVSQLWVIREDDKYPDIEDHTIEEPESENPMKDIFQKLNLIQVSRDDYIKIFQLYIDVMWFSQKVRISEWASSIYDGPNFLDIPAAENYNTMTLSHVISLMMHEIGVHYVNQSLSEWELLVRWAGNVEKDEWLAILTEGLLQGKSLLENKSAGAHMPYILVWELSPYHIRQKFTDLRMRMLSKWKHGDVDSQRDLRIMRGYPLQWPWSALKDVSYSRWKNKIIDLILSGKFSLLDFYAWKIGIDDIVSGNAEKAFTFKIPPVAILFPDLILFYISLRDTRSDLSTHEQFKRYIGTKYNGIIPDDYLDTVAALKMTTRMGFMRIIKIILPLLSESENRQLI